MNTKKLQVKLVQIISLLIITRSKKKVIKMQSQAIEIIEDEGFRKHINDKINGCTILDLVKQCSIGVGEKYTNKQGLKIIEETIEKYEGKTSEELERVSNLNGDSESESELEDELESELSSSEESELSSSEESELSSSEESESEDEDIVTDYQARREYQTLQQNMNLAERCSVLSSISLVATAGILVSRILYSIEHEESPELMFSGALFLGCVNFLSIGLIFNSNRMIRSNRDQINTLLENTADQQIIQQAQNR